MSWRSVDPEDGSRTLDEEIERALAANPVLECERPSAAPATASISESEIEAFMAGEPPWPLWQGKSAATVEIAPSSQALRVKLPELPRLYVNPIYERMAKTTSVKAETREFIGQKLREGEEFIYKIEQSTQMLQRLLDWWLLNEQDYILKDPANIRKLDRSEAARILHVQTTTVRRLIESTWIEIPSRGLVPLRIFFDSESAG